jgi:hypothetical protein
MTKPGDQRPAAVTQAPDGTWQVIAPDGSMLATCATNAEAWKAYDKLAGELLSPREALNMWIARVRPG